MSVSCAAVYGAYGPHSYPSVSTPTLRGTVTGAGSSGSGSGGVLDSGFTLAKPPGLGGWAEVAGNDDEIQRVATGDRKAIDRLRSGAGLGSASGSASGSGASGSAGSPATGTQTRSQDAQTLGHWCDSAAVR